MRSSGIMAEDLAQEFYIHKRNSTGKTTYRRGSIPLDQCRFVRRGTSAFEASLGIHRGSTLLEDLSRPVTPVVTKDDETKRNFLESMSEKKIKNFRFVEDYERGIRRNTKRLSIKYPLHFESIESPNILENLIERSKRRRMSRLTIEQRQQVEGCLLKKVVNKVTALNTFLSSLENLRILKGNTHTCSLKVLIWLVIFSRRLAKAMADVSYQMTPKTAAMSAWEHIASTRNSYNFEFDRNDFKHTSMKTGLYVPAWVKEILDKPIHERSEDDVKTLNRAVSALCKFNEKFTYSVRTAMCKSFGYLKIGENRVVLRAGHVGHHFYLIYSGSVFINRQEYDLKRMENIWRTVNVLERGDSFGEIALLKDNSERRATVVTREETEFLIVPREVFTLICPKALDEELNIKMKIAKSMKLFENWSEKNLRNVCVDAKVYHIPANRVAVDENVDLQSSLFVCLEGKCSVIKKLEITKENGHFLMESNSNDPLHFYKSQPDPYFVSKFNREMRDIVLSSNDASGESTHFAESSLSQRFADTYRRSAYSSLPMPRLAARQGHSFNIPNTKFADREMEVIFMCVANLDSADIFNLNEFLSGGYEKLILMSHGCKLIRFERAVFFRYCTKKNLQRAKILSELHRYTCGESLLKAYTDTIKWKDYKEKTIKNVIIKRNEKLHKNIHLPAIVQNKSRKKKNKHMSRESKSLEEIIRGRNPELKVSRKSRYSITGELLSKFS